MSIYRASVLSTCSLYIYLSYDTFVSKVEVSLVWETNKGSEKVGFSILTESTKLSCCFRTRSYLQLFPELERQSIHHHALIPSQAIDTESDSNHGNPEPGNA